MTSRRSVLIVTHAADDHVPRVEAELVRRGTAFSRFNTDSYVSGCEAQFVSEARAQHSVLRIGGRECCGDVFAAVYFRHFKTPVASHVDDPEARRMVVSEMTAALEGCVLALEPALWVNHPQANQNTRNKVLQLRVATNVGFEVPDTLITADPDQIRCCFARWDGQMVAKLVGGQVVGHTTEDQFVVHTTRLDAADLEDSQSLAASPAIYQRLVPKDCDVRVTVVGETIFACRIGSQADVAGQTDWRAAGFKALAHDVIVLPDAIQQLCRTITRRFGLHMAGIDLIQRPDGTFVFLEVNAAGQWAWIEDMTGLPIADEIARQLTEAVI
ncbi:MAG: MvdC/MvdD family ATP grasp protein [Hyphomicrobium sp.]